MVDLLTVVLAAGLAFMLAAMWAKAQGRLPRWVKVSGPITTLHTERGKAFLDWLAGPKRFWRAWGNFGVGIALVVMAVSFFGFLLAAYQAVINPTPSALNQPRNALAIPGVNQFLPLSVAGEILLGLLLGLVVHEGGHGLLCRVEDIDIESMGLALLTFLPIGAFVEPDEESRMRASRGAQTRMFAAGVTNNFALALVALLLLVGPVAGSLAVVDGVPVGGSIEHSPAREAGIDRGDVVQSVEGRPVANASELDAALNATDARTVTVGLKGGAVAVNRSVLVTSAVRGIPVPFNSTIAAVNGTTVYSEGAFYRGIRDRPVATLTLESGGNVTMPMGVYSVPMAGEPLAEAGAPTDETVYLTRVADERVVSTADLTRALADTEPGGTITVVGYVAGDGGYERRSYEVTLTERDGSSFLGVNVAPGTSGFVVEDFGIDPYPAEAFLGVLGGDAPGLGTGSFIQRAFSLLLLPFLSAMPAGGIDYGFQGFVDPWTNFFVVQGPLAALGPGAVFVLANVLFWAWWINVVIGQFNCVPTYPLDGGHILRSSVEAVVSRLPVEGGRALTRAVTLTVSFTMVASILLMLFAPQLLT